MKRVWLTLFLAVVLLGLSVDPPIASASIPGPTPLFGEAFTPDVDEVNAGEEDPEPCPVIGTANGVDIYRCEDYEYGTLCYSNAMMIFCLEN